MKDNVKIEYYKCGHIFSMDKQLYIRAISVFCPKCKEYMAKEVGFCKDLLEKKE